ncbi:MAG: hypothetical protein AB1671_16345 [Thermodesulfobacteriota bacterium]
MLRPFTVQDLRPLLASHPGPCISLFLPTHRRPPGTEQDPVRFKNLLGTVEGLLRKEYPSRDVNTLLAPLRALLQEDFWQRQLDGLAVFRATDLTVHYRIPMRFPERAVVADSFHLAPLVQFLQSNRYFYVLALSQQSVEFYQGTPYSLGRVDLPALPTSLVEELGIEQREAFLNLHAATAGRGGAIFHGHGVPPTENKKAELARFFRAVDDALWQDVLREERAPLVLAGVEYYHPIYREVSRYQYIVPQGVTGNFEHAAPEDIHAKVWPIIREVFRAREDALLDEYARLVGQGQSIDELPAIARAMLEGRVHRLLLAEGAHLWGILDRTNGIIIPRPAQQDTRDDDVLDDLAEGVLTRGGEVYLLPAERMPSDSPAAAVLRW